MGKIEEKLLLYKIRKKDKQAYIKAYDLYINQLYRFIYFKVGSREEAEDLSSAVFLKAWHHILGNSLKDEKTLKALLYKIARNLIIDHYRKSKARETVSLDGSGGGREIVDEKQNAGQLMEARADWLVLETKLPELKDEYREIIILRFINQLSVKEIADILNKPKGNVRVLIFRALGALRELVSKNENLNNSGFPPASASASLRRDGREWQTPMDEKALLKKLNNLKNIEPDSVWKSRYREVLYSQISAGSAAGQPESNLKIIWESIRPREIFAELAKPVWLTGAACVLILAVGIGGVYASKNSKPGDSLYIAKIISERTQLAMTFNEKDKAKLGLEFAANRAKEITQVLKDEGQSDASKEKLENLAKNFKKEISQAKGRLTAIKSASQQAKDDEPVFGANLEKTDQRMEIAEPAKPVEPKNDELKPAAEPPAAVATSTQANASQTDKMLEEAEKMFDEKNYDGTIDKLEEVNKVINQAAKDDKDGQIKGESETATSTK